MVALAALLIVTTGAAGRARTQSSASCFGTRVPNPETPLLTDRQVIVALHQPVVLGTHSAGASPTCEWHGKALEHAGPYRPYSVQLWFVLHGPFRSAADAHAHFERAATAFGRPTRAPGLGSEAAFVPGQDEVSAQLVVRAGTLVFTLSLNSSQSQAAQRADLATAATELLSRLGDGARTVSPRRWATDWAGRAFCHTRSHGSQYLHTTWHGVAACGAEYPNNDQGTIRHGKVVFDTVGFQCVELAERYFYFVTGQPGPFANGSDLAEAIYYAWRHKDPGLGLHPLGALGRTTSYRPSLRDGDIVSMWSDRDEIGHVGVVISADVHGGAGHEHGAIRILNENTTEPNGVNTITVSNGRLWFADGGYPYFQWLYGIPGAG